MRRTLTTLSIALCLMTSARAQELTYALPSTTITVKVEVEQEDFFAGPYASFSYKFLNMDAQDTDTVTSRVVGIELIPRVEADQSALYTCDPDNAALLSLTAQGLVALQNKADAAQTAWRFPAPGKSGFPGTVTNPFRDETRITYQSVQTEDGEVQVPVEHKVKEAKNPEDKAAEAAEMILSVRQDRLNIVSGNTDASYSGEAMGAALKELDRIEKEYMALFKGYSVKRRYSVSFDVVPTVNQSVQRYLAFRLTDNGPVSDGQKGTPYYLELEPEKMAFADEEERSKSKNKYSTLRYRIPAACAVKLTRDGHSLLESRILVYQLGIDANFPLYK